MYYTLHTHKITDQFGVIDNEHLYCLDTYSPHRNINIIEPVTETGFSDRYKTSTTIFHLFFWTEAIIQIS